MESRTGMLVMAKVLLLFRERVQERGQCLVLGLVLAIVGRTVGGHVRASMATLSGVNPRQEFGGTFEDILDICDEFGATFWAILCLKLINEI